MSEGPGRSSRRVVGTAASRSCGGRSKAATVLLACSTALVDVMAGLAQWHGADAGPEPRG